MGVTLKRDSESPSETKINNFKDALLLVHEKVLRLQISVKNTMGVAVSDTFAQLEEEALLLSLLLLSIIIGAIVGTRHLQITAQHCR